MMRNLLENRQDYIWPKTDTKCWNYMLTHADLPQKICALVDQKNVIVQAGGNAGYYVKEYAKHFKWVYTFEPEPLNFYCLTQNADTQNVFKYQACIGDKRGLVDLHIKEGNRGKNYVRGVGKIPTMLIDDLGLEECNLIHLDIEGYEYFALKGAVDTIKKCKPLVVLEFFDKCATRFNYTLEDLENFMNSLGYKLFTTFEEERVYKPI
jgi:FkbM family methyltransferase